MYLYHFNPPPIKSKKDKVPRYITYLLINLSEPSQRCIKKTPSMPKTELQKRNPQ